MRFKKSTLTILLAQLCLVLCLLCACEPIAMRPVSAEQPHLERISKIPPGELRYKIQFVTKEQAWLANEKRLWRTSNAGKEWDLIQSVEAYGQEIINFEMLDSQVGWVLKYSGLYKTEDGGATWIPIGLPMDFPKGDVRDINFLKDGKTGWAVGGAYRPIARKKLLTGGFPNNTISPNFDAVLYGAIYRTDDGGKTWQEQLLSDAAGRFTHIYFRDLENGFTLGDAGLFYTNDGGRRWVKAAAITCSGNHAPLEFQRRDPACATFIESGNGWLCYGDGHLLKTTDGGHTWCELVPARNIWPEGTLNAFFQEMHFADSAFGWGLGSDGTLHNTTDGGSTWVRLDIDSKFHDMFFLNSTQGWLVATDGLYELKGKKEIQN